MGWLDQRVGLRALAAGVAVDWLGTYFTLPFLALAYGLTPDTPEGRLQELATSPGFLLTVTAHGTFFTALGAYVAARLAPGEELRHAVIVGILSLVLALVLRLSPPEAPAFPWWAEVLGYLLPVPAAAAAGWLARLRLS